MSDLITTSQRGSIFEIVLNRKDKRNAINWEMYQQLDKAITAVSQADDVRVVMIRGEGPVFSAGIDVSSFLELPQRYGPEPSVSTCCRRCDQLVILKQHDDGADDRLLVTCLTLADKTARLSQSDVDDGSPRLCLPCECCDTAANT